MKILYLGDLWEGSTSLQRVRAFRRQSGVDLVDMDTGLRLAGKNPIWHRIRWRLRWPVDSARVNGRLLEAQVVHRPDVILVDNSKVIARATLERLKARAPVVLAYYTGDDIMSRHNLSHPLRRSFPAWDAFFTTKTFNVEELRRAGARNALLIGKSFDPDVHRPLGPSQVGADFERFDLVFIGTHETERRNSLNALAAAEAKIVVYGGRLGGWRREDLHPNIELREALFEHEYTRAMHHGRIALCFLRKMNRDRITQRTMEIAGAGRAMLAEKTEEHDQHFTDGIEYLGFRGDASLVKQARKLLGNEPLRLSLARSIRERALRSGYSTDVRADGMIRIFQDLLRHRRGES